MFAHCLGHDRQHTTNQCDAFFASFENAATYQEQITDRGEGEKPPFEDGHAPFSAVTEVCAADVDLTRAAEEAIAETPGMAKISKDAKDALIKNFAKKNDGIVKNIFDKKGEKTAGVARGKRAQ